MSYKYMLILLESVVQGGASVLSSAFVNKLGFKHDKCGKHVIW